MLFLDVAVGTAAGLFVLMGAQFLGMILIIVYVGVVALLFLFVVMMLDIDFVRLRQGFQRYAPIGAVIGGILFLELVFVLGAWQSSGQAEGLRLNAMPEGVQNTVAIGRVLYTDYVFLFQGAGLILLVSMIGAIVLTHRDRVRSRRQDIEAQVTRRTQLDMARVPVGASIGELGILRPPVPEEKPKVIAHDDHGHGGHH